MEEKMLDIINQPDMQQYAKKYASGETLFLEGDYSQDMYILKSGRLEVYKGDKKIAELADTGTTAGELSYLFGSKRTATIKAFKEVEAIKVPADQIKNVLFKYPPIAHEITMRLARRLEETTKIMHGLREFNDQLPDAIIMADKERNILSWNHAAEKLHGRTWQQMKGYPLADLYQDPQAYEQFVADIQAGNSLQEKELAVKHPDRNKRIVSTSTTVLYDGHHNVEGFIFLSRDVTDIKDLEKKYKRMRRWLIPSILFFCVAMISLFFTFPYLSRGNRILDYKKDTFEVRIIQSSQNIANDIAAYLATGNFTAVNVMMQIYFENENPEHYGIIGLALLNRDKKVVSAYSSKKRDRAAAIIGSSYSGIKFKGDEKAAYKILTLFRADKKHRMGAKGLEIAYEIRGEDGEITNWLIYQLDMEILEREYGIDTKILSRLDFQKE
ncbi:cAMP-binding proteins [Candidatus Scalindua japonica]|uniref:cAMP-binding proteins n=1 Tax=Candidatus Scalindua japonica TaxID=1284222 RepID=A0A286TZ06_9BACT|nr:cyclic nucleotide-binding domain-containing protein [Candidatus Scalindua japonica]GAX61106.1 cAMP-binding proteins [Candidatus Scalindua japonica]